MTPPALVSCRARAAACVLAGVAFIGPSAFAQPGGTAAPADLASHGHGPNSLDVEFDGGAEGVRLFGTLLLPAGATAESPVAGVVLVTGSGPQDRDESIMGRRPFRVLAEGLAARGYAVLRYDDRGTADLGLGRSTGKFLGTTLEEFSADADAGLRFLADQPAVADDRVVICGHSTGGLEAGMVLARRGATGVPAAGVLLASPAVPGADLLIRQSADLLDAAHRLGQSGQTDEQVAAAGAVQRSLISAVAGGNDADILAAATAAARFGVEISNPGLEMTPDQLSMAIEQVRAPFRDPWMAHFVRYDPAADLAAASVPVLAVFGGLDLQVPADQNSPPATGAIRRSGRTGSAVVVLPAANHLFQRATSGLPQEYGLLPDEMNPELVAVVADWLDRVLPAGAGPSAP